MSSDSALSVVASFDHAHAAHLAVQRLEAAGMEAFVQDEYAVGALPFHNILLGGVKVAVRTERLEEAREVLGEKDASFRRVELPRESRREAFLAWCACFVLPFVALVAGSIVGGVLAFSDHVAWGVAVCVVSALPMVASYGRWRRRGGETIEAGGLREDEPCAVEEW